MAVKMERDRERERERERIEDEEAYIFYILLSHINIFQNCKLNYSIYLII